MKSPADKKTLPLTEAEITPVVCDMHVVPMTMALIHLTGDVSLLDRIEPYVKGPWDYSQTVPDEVKSGLQDLMIQALLAHYGGRPAVEISEERMQRMLEVAAAEPVGKDYAPMIRAQMGVQQGLSPARSTTERSNFHVVIVGAGVSGICAAIKLKEAGIAFEILEKNSDVGGTWFENTYPGCAVDTPNHFYQYSFEPNDDWPNYYSRQAANLDYFRMCAEKYGIRNHIRFNTEVKGAHYNEVDKTWSVSFNAEGADAQTVHANALICAVGQLNRPSIPAFAGLDSFKGTVTHTAQWPEGLDVTGKNVALVGAGASAVQFGCAVAGKVKTLSILQRSGSWIVRSPNIHRTVSEEMKWALKNVPFYAAWYRFQLFWGFADGLYPALQIDRQWDGDKRSINAKNDRIRKGMTRYIESELEGREDLLAKVVPDYPPYGKRVLADPGWFKMLKRDNVSLISTPIAKIEPEGIRLADGELTPADVIVMATGFMAGKMLWPMDIVGTGGKTIRQAWGDNDPRAYLGITVPDFPNLFVMYGPNTGLGHGGSFTFLAECQVRYIVGCITEMADSRIRSLVVKTPVFYQYNEDIDKALKDFVWSHDSVQSWYKNANGRIIINSPWRLVDYWNLTLKPDLRDYITEY